MFEEVSIYGIMCKIVGLEETVIAKFSLRQSNARTANSILGSSPRTPTGPDWGLCADAAVSRLFCVVEKVRQSPTIPLLIQLSS